MRVPIYQVDAFATKRFTGNPAAVVLLESFPSALTMQAIAAENNLAETAFVVRQADHYHIRWFTPTVEVPFCGHATLASAAVVMHRDPRRLSVAFQSASGVLTVERHEASYVMNFPARRLERVNDDEALTQALGARPSELHRDSLNNYLALFDHANAVRTMEPNLHDIFALGRTGVIVTAPGDEGFDIVSRYFAPNKGIPEDPVTGGAHCALTPFWSARTGLDTFRAYQASVRGGEMLCRLIGDRVELQGGVVFYLEGEIEF
jgi:PhzF family phenazine biosynthesis protein